MDFVHTIKYDEGQTILNGITQCQKYQTHYTKVKMTSQPIGENQYHSMTMEENRY